MSPSSPSDGPPPQSFAVACVALVFLSILAAIVAPVIEEKVLESRAAEAQRALVSHGP